MKARRGSIPLLSALYLEKSAYWLTGSVFEWREGVTAVGVRFPVSPRFEWKLRTQVREAALNTVAGREARGFDTSNFRRGLES